MQAEVFEFLYIYYVGYVITIFSHFLHFQDLYQYVLTQDVIPPFSLYIPHPRQLLMLSEDSIIPYDETLLIVAKEDQSYDQTVIDVLSDEWVSFSFCMLKL